MKKVNLVIVLMLALITGAVICSKRAGAGCGRQAKAQHCPSHFRWCPDQIVTQARMKCWFMEQAHFYTVSEIPKQSRRTWACASFPNYTLATSPSPILLLFPWRHQ